MKKLFLVAVITLLCMPAIAENLWLNTLEGETYYANKSVIDSLLFLRHPEEMRKIEKRYIVPPDGYAKIDHYVMNRELKYICQDFLYKDSLDKRVFDKIVIENIYRDSINSILIPQYENHISGDNVSMALYYSKSLHLDSTQYSYIMAKAIDMARRIYRDHRINVWNEEMEILKKTLNKKQLRSFFVKKNSGIVTLEFNNAWKKLKEVGLTEQLDSAKDANDAINYIFKRQMIKDLYRSYGTPQKKYLAELDKNKPKMMSMLEGLDKKARLKEEEKTKTVSKEFVW